MDLAVLDSSKSHGNEPGYMNNGIQIQKTGDRSAGWSVRLLTVIRYKKLTDRHSALWYT